jgi:signal transduction histidine kinase/HAMP domain-containing protein
MRPGKLFHRTLVILVLLFGIASAATAVFSAWNIDHHLTKEYESKGTAVAVSIADGSVELLLFQDASTVQAMIDQFREIQGVAYVFVEDAQRELIAHTFAGIIPDAIRNLDRPEQGTAIRRIQLNGQGEVIDIASPILAGKAGYVHVGMDRELIRASIWSAIAHQLILMAILFLLSVLAAAWFVNRIARPLNTLTGYAKAVAAGSAAEDGKGETGSAIRAVAARTDEVGQLAQAFRHLVLEVSAREQDLRKMHGDLEIRVRERTAELQQSNATLQRQIGERQRAQDELRRTQDTLEDIVRERTAALVQANKALLAENTERQRAEEALGQALQGLRQHSRQMRGLAQAALAMNSERALAVVLQIVTDQARAILGVHQAVTSLTVDQNWAQAVTNLSFSEKYAAYRTYDTKPDGSGIYALVCETNRPLRLTQAELEAHPRWRGFGTEAGRHPPLVGWLAAPLVDREGKNLGLIQLSDKVDGEFTAEDEAILVQLAQMASVTLEIRQAHEALEERVQERTAALTQANKALQLEIADRVRAQEALARQAQALARSNAELEQFAYVASHDLQEPLRMVASYTQLLADRYRGQLDDKADRWIGYAVEGVTRMRGLIDDLLAYSRAGRPGQADTPTDCGAVLAKALTHLQKPIEESGAVVTHDPLPSVRSGGPHLLHLFQNLISNALKFHGPEPPRIHVSAQDKGTDWLLSVRDNGIGIAPEHFERIFVLFQRLHSRQEYPGTGIGLAICKKIVEQHGGHISVESQPGHGTTFYFTLPKQGEGPG